MDQAANPFGSPLFGERGSLRQAISIPLAIGLASEAYSAIPILLSKHNRLDDLWSISAQMVPLTLGGAFLIFFLALRGVRHRIDGGRNARPFLITVIGSSLVAAIGGITVNAYMEHQLARDLNQRGIPAQARLVRTFTQSCGRSGCTHGVEYAFTPRGSTSVIRGVADEGKNLGPDNYEYNYIVSTKTVPILYDMTDPHRSAVYWRDNVARQASIGSMLFGVVLWSVFLLVIAIPMVLIVWGAMQALEARKRTASDGEAAAS